jgi:hypothetical protein
LGFDGRADHNILGFQVKFSEGIFDGLRAGFFQMSKRSSFILALLLLLGLAVIGLWVMIYAAERGMGRM